VIREPGKHTEYGNGREDGMQVGGGQPMEDVRCPFPPVGKMTDDACRCQEPGGPNPPPRFLHPPVDRMPNS